MISNQNLYMFLVNITLTLSWIDDDSGIWTRTLLDRPTPPSHHDFHLEDPY